MADIRKLGEAADQLAAAAEEFARQFNSHSEPLGEEEADRLGVLAVREYRRENIMAGGFDGDRGPLTEEEVAEWEKRREERRRREGYKPI